jgi:hypothetical protein
VPGLQRAPLTRYHFLHPRCLSTKGQVDQSYLAATTTLWGYLHLRRVLTLYDAGLGQGSPHGRRLGFRLRGGSGLLSGRIGLFTSHRCGGFISLPG